MTPVTGTQTITINILPDIWKSKDNQAIKLAHLIKDSMRNLFR